MPSTAYICGKCGQRRLLSANWTTVVIRGGKPICPVCAKEGEQ